MEIIEFLAPPNKAKGALFVKDFSNPIDLVWLKQAMNDEDIEYPGLNLEWA